jgi:hypothetical protein
VYAQRLFCAGDESLKRFSHYRTTPHCALFLRLLAARCIFIFLCCCLSAHRMHLLFTLRTARASCRSPALARRYYLASGTYGIA